MNHSASINMGRTTMCPIVTLFVYHSKKISRNTDRFVSRARLFGSFHWKFSGKKRISEKTVPFSRWKLSDGNTDVFPSPYQFQASRVVSQLDAFRFFVSVKMACTYSSEDSVQSLYECSVSPFLAFHFQSLLLHYCGTCLNRR